MPKPLTVWITTNSWKFLKRWKYQTTWPASWEICMQVKKQQLELDMEQQTGFKLGKEYVRAIYCDLTYLAYMQSASWEMLGWMKHKLESRLPSEISITLDRQMTPCLWLTVKRNWRASWMWKRRVRKLALFKLSIQKNSSYGIQSQHFMANIWGNNGNSERIFSWPPKSLQMVTAAMKLKDACSLEEKLWPT